MPDLEARLNQLEIDYQIADAKHSALQNSLEAQHKMQIDREAQTFHWLREEILQTNKEISDLTKRMQIMELTLQRCVDATEDLSGKLSRIDTIVNSLDWASLFSKTPKWLQTIALVAVCIWGIFGLLTLILKLVS